MNTLLFPTDYSECSHNAFLSAVHLAKAFKANIVTLHIYHAAPVLINYDYPIAWDVLGQQEEWDQFDSYREEVQKLRQIADENYAENIAMSHLLDKGNVVDAILDATEKNRADFIVIGSKGANELEAFFGGTIAEKVMNQSTVNVIVIPEKWGYKRITKILFLTHFHKKDQKILRKLLNFAEVLGASVQALWICGNPDINKELVLQDWYDRFSQDPVQFEIITGMHVERIVNDYIETHPTELIALSVHHKNALQKLFLHSVAEELAFHSKIPIMAIRQ